MKKYTVSQISDMLEINPETIRRWIRDNKLEAEQASRKSGNLVTEEALIRFLKDTPKYAPRAEQKGLDLSSPVEIKIVDRAMNVEGQPNARGRLKNVGLGDHRSPFQKAIARQVKASAISPKVLSPDELGCRVIRVEEMAAQLRAQQREIEALKRQVKILKQSPRTSSGKKK